MSTVAFGEIANNAHTFIADATITNSVTTINVDSAAALGLNDSTTLAYLTIISAASYRKDPINSPETLEIIKVTAVSTNALTVTRGVDGTSGTAFVANDIVEVRNNAANLVDVQGAITDHTKTINVAGNTGDFAAESDMSVAGFLNVVLGLTITLDTNGDGTATGSYHRIDTFAAASTDDCSTIAGGSAGDILILAALSSARDVTIVQTGNFRLGSGGDFTFGTTDDRIMLLSNGTNWFELARSN